MTLPRDPVYGLSVIHVIPAAWGPHVDLRASYRSLARRRPWVRVISTEQYDAHRREKTAFWMDPNTAFVLWDLSAAIWPGPGPRHDRGCLVAAVYSEALDPDEHKLLPDHATVWRRFVAASGELDGVLGHTPLTTELLGRASCPAFTMPAGWDEAAMGAPRWDAPKHDELVYWGSGVGRREIVWPYLQSALARTLISASGTYGRALLGQLDTTRAALYIAHSDVASYSTWRLWQQGSTSCALLSEPGDSWPFVVERHYLGIAPFTIDNAWQVVLQIRELLSRHDQMRMVTEAAHEEICRTYTVDHVTDTYLLPALASMANARTSA